MPNFFEQFVGKVKRYRAVPAIVDMTAAIAAAGPSEQHRAGTEHRWSEVRLVVKTAADYHCHAMSGKYVLERRRVATAVTDAVPHDEAITFEEWVIARWARRPEEASRDFHREAEPTLARTDRP